MKTLVKKILIKGTVKTITGLHIGGSNNTLQIGGLDNSVIRNPIDNKPYIPGSSLKGKIRCLLEQSLGVAGTQRMGKVEHGATDKNSGVKATPILNLFGTASGDNDNIPSKLIVRDCTLLTDESLFIKADLPYTESKTEIVVDRITAAAMPRQIERVPAGAEFSFEMVVNIFDQDNEKEMIDLVTNGMRILQDDYLGGKGSRGSGQIKFSILEMKERKAEFYNRNDATAEKKYDYVIPNDLKK